MSSKRKGRSLLNKPPFILDSELKKAFQYYQSGQLPKAEQICKRILGTNANAPCSLHLLAGVAHQLGKNDVAVNCIT